MLNLTQKSTQLKEKKPKFIQTELGTEKLCIQCQEYWPLDNEFWFTYSGKPKKDGSRSVCYEAACKCCYYIRYKPQRQSSYKMPLRSYHEKRGYAE